MWEILGGLLVGTAASGILPLVNAELLVVGVVVAAPEIGIPLVAAVSTHPRPSRNGVGRRATWAEHVSRAP